MKPLPLNLASRPFRNNLLVGTLLGVVGAALVFGTAYNLYVYLSYGAAYATLQHAQEEDRARIIELQKQERDLAAQVKTRDFRRAYDRGKLASELIRKSAFSWTQLFNTLETVIPPDVVLSAIRPNISSEGIVLRVEGIAKNHMALLTLEEKLQQQQESFKRVAPISERRLNPSLPDITFLVTCDYIPPAPAAPVVTASNDAAAPGAPAGPGASANAPAAADPKAPADRNAAAAAGATAPAGAQDKTAKGRGAAGSGNQVAAGIVGRDGRPKAEAGSVIAPGGILIAQAIAAPSSGKRDAKKTPSHGTAAPKATGNVAAPTAGATGSAVSAAPKPAAPGTMAKTPDAGTSGANAAAPKVAGNVSAPRPAAGNAAPGQSVPQGAPPAAATPQKRAFGPRGYDPNVPRTMPANLAAAANKPKPDPPPARAERLDVPLTFVGRPAGEVYRTLAEAHGVRIDLDASVDAQAPVTLDLKGRRLEEALQLLAGLLHTRATRPAEGIYRIVSTDVRAPGGDAPVTEEPVVEESHR